MTASASFRDPDGRVFELDGRILRGFTEEGLQSWTAAEQAGLIPRLIENGSLVDHRLVGEAIAAESWAGLIEATRIPVITYPYEWSFEMLRQAALLTLHVSSECLAEGFQLKDASAYNVAFDRGQPVFIDVGSIEHGYSGLWIGYSQFVSHFLLPLLITSRLGIPFQPLLRTYLEGIPLDVGARMFHGTKSLGKGVGFHVRYANRVTRRSTQKTVGERKDIAKNVQVPVSAARANVDRMTKLIAGLDNPLETEWGEYEVSNSYSETEAELKESFVAAAGERFGGEVAWDVGANAGRFSVALLRHFDQVVSIEPDPGAADLLFRRAAEHPGLHPVVMDITDPSPDRGWRLNERSRLTERAKPDFAIWLAVIHHLCLGRGYPLDQVLDHVAELTPAAVVEYVDPDDDMSQELLASRPTIPHGYSRELFDRQVSDRFEIVSRQTIKPTRELLLLKTKQT